MNHSTPTALQREYDDLWRDRIDLIALHSKGKISGLNYVNKLVQLDTRRAAIGRILFQGADSAE